MSDSSLKDIMKQEYIKCLKDPIYFLKKYVQIQHPQRGRIPFHLFDFQEKVLRLFDQHDYAIINKSRQLGISTLVAGFALWLILFHSDKSVLCIATKEETAKNLVTKVRFMYESIPSWLKEKDVENSKLSLRLSNGSGIKASSAASDSGRSESLSLLIIDEAAFIDGIDEIWTSAQQTLSGGGKCMAISTPYGTGNWFHRTWVKGEQKENEFLPIKLPWWVHPDRDEKWRKRQDELLGDPKIAAQECDCDFNTSGDTVFPNDWIDYQEQTHKKDPIEVTGIDSSYWKWRLPDYSRDYMVIADVARGDGKDFSTFHVFDIENCEQVAEWKGNLSTKDFAQLLFVVGTEWNNALLVVENNNIGWSTAERLEEMTYRNLYYSPKSDIVNPEEYIIKMEQQQGLVPGFVMSNRTRPLAINKFREYLSDNSIIIHSKRTIAEMKVFIWKNGRPEAQSGYNDDLIMPISIFSYLHSSALRLQQHNLDSIKAAWGATNRTSTSYANGFVGPNSQVENPYKFKIRGKEEDIRWLF